VCSVSGRITGGLAGGCYLMHRSPLNRLQRVPVKKQWRSRFNVICNATEYYNRYICREKRLHVNPLADAACDEVGLRTIYAANTVGCHNPASNLNRINAARDGLAQASVPASAADPSSSTRSTTPRRPAAPFQSSPCHSPRRSMLPPTRAT
jgi:hypothetical protein